MTAVGAPIIRAIIIITLLFFFLMNCSKRHTDVLCLNLSMLEFNTQYYAFCTCITHIHKDLLVFILNLLSKSLIILRLGCILFSRLSLKRLHVNYMRTRSTQTKIYL